MQVRFDPKLILFFVLLIATEIYMIGAYGAVEASHGHPTRELRDISRALLLGTSIAGLFLLPSRRPGDFPIPRIPKSLGIILGLLLSWGLFSIFNAKTDQRLFEFIYRPNKDIFWEWGPGTTTSTTSKGFVAELAIMIVFVLMVAKSTLSNAWKGILGSFVFCGVAITILGIGHQMLGMQHIYGIEKAFGLESAELPETYFAPYVYNANAASFLNLAVAIGLGLAFYTHRQNPHNNFFYIWLACVAVCAIGVIGAASKAGVILLVFQVGAFLLWECKYLLKMFKKRKSGPAVKFEKKIAIGLVAAMFVVMGGLVVSKVAGRFDELIESVQSEKGSATMEGRRVMRELVWDVIKDQEKVGWRGHGAGSFAHFFPFLITPEHSEQITQRWHFVHCDPLQTIAEWGYPGAALWFAIGIGALLRSFYLAWSSREGSSNSHLFKGLTIGIVTISIHSVYDFPFSVFSIHVMVFAALTVMWTLKNNSTMRSSS